MDQCDIEQFTSVHKLIFILGIDALDYELVEKLNLNNLKQLEHSKIVVPINKKVGIPTSPEVWASFLIGEHMPMNFASSSHYINTMKKIIDLFHIGIHNRFRRKVSDFFVKLGFGSSSQFGRLNKKTFLDITRSKKINAPYYNFENKTFRVSSLFGCGKLSLDQTVEKIKSLYEYRKKQILNEIDNIGGEDVIFAFMHTTDLLQHLLFLHITEIERHYIDLDNYVLILKRKFENTLGNVIFIIISDHGFDFDMGTHSKYAFYSSNTHLIPKPEKITDFYGIILDLINKHNGLSLS